MLIHIPCVWLLADTFKSYAQRHPELSKIYTTYQEQKLREQHKSIDKDKFSNGHAAELEQWSNQGDESSKKLQWYFVCCSS